jgi:hypothetical protein
MLYPAWFTDYWQNFPFKGKSGFRTSESFRELRLSSFPIWAVIWGRKARYFKVKRRLVKIKSSDLRIQASMMFKPLVHDETKIVHSGKQNPYV